MLITNNKLPRSRQGMGLILVLIALAIVSVLVVLNWDKINRSGVTTPASVKEGQQKVNQFKDDVHKLEQRMQEKLDEGLHPEKP